MTIAATTRKRDKLAAQLTWLANRYLLISPEDRRHGRMAPRSPIATLILPNGVNVAFHSRAARWRPSTGPISAPA